MSLGELLIRVGGRKGKRHLSKILSGMVARGELSRVPPDQFVLRAEKMPALEGKIRLHRDGYGFVTATEKDQEDVFIPARYVGSAMNGDLVQVELGRPRHAGRREGKVVRVVERSVREIVGIYHQGRHGGMVLPSGKGSSSSVHIPQGNSGEVRAGQLVIAKIENYPTDKKAAEGRIVRILGDPKDPKVEVLAVAHRFGLPWEFSELAMEQAEKVPRTVMESDWQGRHDLCGLPFVTIDGETAKDFDDAVALRRETDGGYRLWVAVADVGHYVSIGSPLDVDALDRGTSVYFPGSCLPMLPEELSNGICSLNPGVERLVMVAELQFDHVGQLNGKDFYQGVIRSRGRLTYSGVQKHLDGEKPLVLEDQRAVDQLAPMKELVGVLLEKRDRRGGIDFDLPEADIQLDKKGQPVGVRKARRYFAHRLIEEFMLAANEAVATFLEVNQVPLLFRIHEPPAREKLEEFQQYLAHFNLGFRLEAEGADPHELQRLLAEVAGTPMERMINQVLLRSMRQASYNAENLGHFGLAMESYCHFTSPIRRYPDLVVHRALHRFLTGKPPIPQTKLLTLGEDLSWKERRAMEAERDMTALKICQFMQPLVGEEFRSVVSGVVPFGLFVELKEHFVEGLVHIRDLTDDFYQFEEDLQRLVGTGRRRIFQVGDELEVRLVRVDTGGREIDFVPVAVGPLQGESRRKKTR